MKFTQSYWKNYRRNNARARKRATERKPLPYKVTVYNSDTREAIEVKRFNTYDSAIAAAIEYQHNASEKQYYYGELYEKSRYFYKQAKRYGLVKEFHENGII